MYLHVCTVFYFSVHVRTVCVYVYTVVILYIYVFTYLCIYAYMCVHVYVCVHVCMYLCMYEYEYDNIVGRCVLSIYPSFICLSCLGNRSYASTSGGPEDQRDSDERHGRAASGDLHREAEERIQCGMHHRLG